MIRAYWQMRLAWSLIHEAYGYPYAHLRYWIAMAQLDHVQARER